MHTGGTDGDFIRIPDCSGSEYYADHHILIQSPGWTVAMWGNDHRDHLIYWSPGDFYSEGHVILTSGDSNGPDLAILIQGSGPGVTVTGCTFRT